MTKLDFSAPRALLAFCLILASLTARADVYKFVSASGEIYFTQPAFKKRPIEEFTGKHRYRSKLPTGFTPGGMTVAYSNSPSGASYDAWVQTAALDHGLDPKLIHAVIQTESAYNPFAISSKGAQGLMQLMPSTAERFGVINPMDAEENIAGGTHYLKTLLNQFDSDLELALAAYNSGENNVIRHGNKVPPFSETQKYVRKVLDLYQRQ